MTDLKNSSTHVARARGFPPVCLAASIWIVLREGFDVVPKLSVKPTSGRTLKLANQKPECWPRLNRWRSLRVCLASPTSTAMALIQDIAADMARRTSPKGAVGFVSYSGLAIKYEVPTADSCTKAYQLIQNKNY